MKEIKIECQACQASGLYIGCAEPKGTAVICIQCNGTGCDTIHFKPFITQKGKRGIEKVTRSQTGNYITYQEFRQGKMP